MAKALSLNFDKNYKLFLDHVKQRIHAAQFRVESVASRELIKFYWEIGTLIIERQKESKWGEKIFDVLAKDLQLSFPNAKGFSKTNLKNMRLFATVYPSLEFGQAVPDQISWTHHIVLLQMIDAADSAKKRWYAGEALRNGWSYRELTLQIKNNIYECQISNNLKTTNFYENLPSPQSELAINTIRDPYLFHFLTLGEDAHEKEIQKGLISHITQFLLALGQGFSFYSSYYPLKVSNKTYEIDLLMYHTRLHCYIVVELKKGEFQPKDVGQLNFYLSAIDNQLKMPEDNPTIGLLLCEKKDKIVAEYSLKDVNKPIGISEYQLSKALPKKLSSDLPSIDEIEAELSYEFNKKSKSIKTP